MLIAIGSAKGSPGASTTAVALTAVWPEVPGVVVEADCAGGDLAGRCWLPDSPGLATLATSARTGTAHLDEHVARLPCGVDVVPAPAGRHSATVAVGLLAETGAATWAGNRPVILDVGRMDEASPAAALVEAAEVLLVCTRADETSLLRLSSAALDADRSRLVLIGNSDYRAEEIAGTVGLPVAAVLPWDPRGAEVLWGRRRTKSGWTRRGLPAAARSLALALTDHRFSPTGPAPGAASHPDGTGRARAQGRTTGDCRAPMPAEVRVVGDPR